MGFIKGYEMLAHLLLGKLGVESPQKWVNGYIVSLAAASVANRMKFVDEEKSVLCPLRLTIQSISVSVAAIVVNNNFGCCRPACIEHFKRSVR